MPSLRWLLLEVCLLSVPLAAQSPPPAPPLPAFEVGVTWVNDMLLSTSNGASVQGTYFFKRSVPTHPTASAFARDRARDRGQARVSPRDPGYDLVRSRRCRCQARRRNTALACRAGSKAAWLRRAPAAGPTRAADARPVVVAEHPVRPAALRQSGLICAIKAATSGAVQAVLQKLEIERQMRTHEVLAVIGDEPLHRQINFADQHPVIEFVESPAASRRPHHALRAGRSNRSGANDDFRLLRGPGRIERIVAKRRILDECQMTSTRKPSTPRRNQKRSTSCIAARTSGFRQLRSGCSAR